MDEFNPTLWMELGMVAAATAAVLIPLAGLLALRLWFNRIPEEERKPYNPDDYPNTKPTWFWGCCCCRRHDD